MTDTNNTTDSNGTSNDENIETVKYYDPPSELICQFGDVTLKANDCINPAKKFQVSTCILAQIAPFFNKLLKGRFQEGEMNNWDQLLPREVELTESPQAVEMLCNVLHHRPYNELKDGTPKQVLEYSMLVQQYLCVDELIFPNAILLRAQIQSHKDAGWKDKSAMLDFVAAAYILKQVVIFRQLTATVATDVSSNVRAQNFDPRCQERISDTLISSLNAHISAAQKTMGHHIMALAATHSKAAGVCKKEELGAKFIERLSDVGLFPPSFDHPDTPVDELVLKMEDIEVPILLNDCEFCTCPRLDDDEGHRVVSVLRPDGGMAPFRSSDKTWHSGLCPRALLEKANAPLVKQRHVLEAFSNVLEI